MKAYGYLRVSSEEQASEGHSIATQEERVLQFCRLKEWNLARMICDAGISAKDLNRKGLKELLGVVERGDIIVVTKLDRIFRNTMDALTVSRDLQKRGVELASIGESIDTSSAIGRFFFTLMASLASLEREQVAERTRAVMGKLKRDGRAYGPPPYGFRTGEGGALLPVREEQEAVGLIRALRDQHRVSYDCIAESLNAQGIRPPARSGRGSGKWMGPTVRAVYLRKGPPALSVG